MIVGDKFRFAVEADLEEVVGGWVLGRFRFWMNGVPVGNWDDVADLKGCLGWLWDFVLEPRDRFEPGLYGASISEVFERVLDPVLVSRTSGGREAIDGAFARFCISHLGMSSMDLYDVVLIKDEVGNERCVWRDCKSGVVGEVYMCPGEAEGVAREFCERFEQEVLG